MLTNIFAVTAAMAATASAFDCSGHYFSFFNRAGPMSYQRLDPALFPGTESPHLHSFDGGNALSASSDFNGQMGSTCTTARIKPDKSLYWRPTLFWNGNNTGFYRVPETAAKIYYKFGESGAWANVTEFPEDFNMITGDPFKRADGNNPAGVRWACHQPDGRSDAIFTNGFPTGFQSCNYGFATEVTFPSCWNGKKLDPSNPNAHMAYPNNYGGGVGVENCPTTHRAARFPTIFIEFWYDISSFNGQYSSSSSPWVLSNGDPTGYGMHADFLNGWEKGVLAKATAETGGCNCGCGCGNDEIKQCFGSDKVNDESDSNFAQCSAGTGGTPTKVEKLPGCNPIQSGPARATVVTGEGCNASAAPVASATSAAVSSAASQAFSAASGAASAVSSVKPEAVSTIVASSAAATPSASRTRRSSSVAAASISLVNKGYGGDDFAYPTANDVSSIPAQSSSTPAAVESISAPFPYPSGNSTVAPTATGQYSSYSVKASSKPHGHNHSKFHSKHRSSKTSAVPAGNTGYPSTPSNDSGDDVGAEAETCTTQAPVTVTYTPTVTVTAQSAALNSTTTLTLTSTVTVQQTIRATASQYKY
ncbi:hypothetical protein OPT61_g2439 [Boeremia exigua]|uniref:Uncharacterized protein n=1 Tax=Boeremia exigua TaxID=749465 RepID=A0ACC2ILM9_9PLEO|nr:hypothetical protein OPT61_g2439 [Boeremia exigua]